MRQTRRSKWIESGSWINPVGSQPRIGRRFPLGASHGLLSACLHPHPRADSGLSGRSTGLRLGRDMWWWPGWGDHE